MTTDKQEAALQAISTFAQDQDNWEQLENARAIIEKQAREIAIALDTIELLYACYTNPEWISYREQTEKINAQALEVIKRLKGL